MKKACLMFFVKYPEPGTVKTRLAEDSTPELAAEFYRTFAEEKLIELEAGVDSDVLVFFAPETQGQGMREWLGSERRLYGQKGADLGRRMENAFRQVFHMGYERAVLVGSDIPGLSADIVNAGVAVLSPSQASIGPAGDGGYYLIGFHRHGFVPEVFHSQEWSKSGVYQQTLNRIADSDVEFVEQEALDDMDTMDDIETMLALGPLGPLKDGALSLARRLVGK